MAICIYLAILCNSYLIKRNRFIGLIKEQDHSIAGLFSAKAFYIKDKTEADQVIAKSKETLKGDATDFFILERNRGKVTNTTEICKIPGLTHIQQGRLLLK